MVVGGVQRAPGPDVEPISWELRLVETSGPLQGGLCKPLPPPPGLSPNSWPWEFSMPSAVAQWSIARPCLPPESPGLSSEEILMVQGSRPGKSA